MSTHGDQTTRVREVIASTGRTQGEFAAEIGLDQSKMSKSLAGHRRFSSLDLARIAEVGGVSVDWLLTGVESPVATAARAATGSSTELAMGEATRLADLRDSATRLGYPQPWQPLAPRKLPERWDAAGVQLAADALGRVDSLGLSPVALDLAAVVEQAFGVDVAIAPLGDGFDGLAISSESTKAVVVGLSTLAYRQRFTLAHELGHILAGDDQAIHSDPDVYSKDNARVPSEVRANAFASAFLMPEDRVRAAVGRDFDETRFCELAGELMVSPSALAIRLDRLQLIGSMHAHQWRSLSAAKAAQIAGTAELLADATAYASTARPPGLLARDLFEAYAAGATTLRPYANLLGTDTEKLRAELERSDEGE